MKMVVGLGNPGREYELTRHNAGFLALDQLADLLGLEIHRESMRALVGEGLYRGERVLLAKPTTFMNLSGEAVGALARWYKLRPEEVIVLHDDLDLEVGRLRVRAGGGDGGHKGIRSLLNHLDGPGFLRVKVGIGRPPAGMETAAYVLSTFREEEWVAVRPVLERAALAAQALLSDDLEEIMNHFNN